MMIVMIDCISPPELNARPSPTRPPAHPPTLSPSHPPTLSPSHPPTLCVLPCCYFAGAQSVPSLRGLPRMHEQPHFRRRFDGLLRDHRGGSGGRTDLARVLCSPHPHDQHAHHRPGDFRASVSGSFEAVFGPQGVGWRGYVSGGGWGCTGDRVYSGEWR